jgi:hypothetical protein
MVSFRVIENSSPAYMEKYEEFIKLYNNPEITVEEIRKQLGWRTKIYNDARKKALEENRIIDRRSPNSIKNCKGRPVKPKHQPKHYYYDRWHDTFVIVKRYYINKKDVVVYYGRYKREDTAKEVVEELKKVDWDKTKLQEIKKKLGLK